MNGHLTDQNLKGTMKKHWANTNPGTSHKITSQHSLQCQDKELPQTEKAKEARGCSETWAQNRQGSTAKSPGTSVIH